MSTLCLTLRERPSQCVDMSPLVADHLAHLSPAETAAIELTQGNRKVRVDSLFTVTGRSASHLEICNSCERLDRIGAGMTHGRIVVQGDTGASLAAGMRGGHVEVQGNVGAFAASGLSGGSVHVMGDAGDFLGGAIPGDRHGMRGGTVLVAGNIGDRAGDRMRRGTLLVEGRAGDYCASRMVAGTIAIWGGVGRFPALAMRRGTLLLLQAPGALLPTFNDCGTYPLGFLSLLVRSWRVLPGRFATLPEGGLPARRFMGDLANDGSGEILIPA
jgi:formylmethanofuran dehydrogenase subunit C